MSDIAPNPKKLFVGSLPFAATEDDLRDLFGQYGDVEEVKVIIDRMSGRPKGIAFVTMGSEGAAEAAIAALHESEYGGRTLVVNVARPPEPRAPRRDFQSGGWNQRPGGSSGFGGGSRFGGSSNFRRSNSGSRNRG